MRLKYTLLMALLVVSIPKLNAQFTKGDKIVGTSLASVFYNTGTADQTVTSIGSVISKISGFGISLSPSLGWFISEKAAVGATLNINPTGEKTTYEGNNGSTFQKDKSNTSNIGIGVFVRNYWGNSGSLLPFGQFIINGGISNLKKEGFLYIGSSPTVNKETYTTKSSGGTFFNAGVNTGFTKMIGENAGLDFFIGYTFSKTKNTIKKINLIDENNDGSINITEENETTTRVTNHGFQLGIGFQIFLKAKKK
jgi:hypothetical protein